MERRMASVAAYEHRGFERDGVDRRDERRQEVLDADHAAGVAAVDVESACTGDAVDEKLLTLGFDGVIPRRHDDRGGHVDVAQPRAGVEVAKTLAEIARVRERRREELLGGPDARVFRRAVEAGVGRAGQRLVDRAQDSSDTGVAVAPVRIAFAEERPGRAQHES